MSTDTPLDTQYVRNIANSGRSSLMTEFLHNCADRIEQLERELAAMTEQLAGARTIAWDWGQGVDDAETAVRKLSRMFPIDTMKEPK